jgi:hypothetical protein
MERRLGHVLPRSGQIEFIDQALQQLAFERPHEALGMKRPADTTQSDLSAPRPHNSRHQLRRICMDRKKINLSLALAGQRVGIKEVDEDIWLVSFTHYDLGYIDLEQKTLQPLDNPFGPKLLPLS